MKKYELTSETKVINGVELHRIKALESFGRVEKGELGGWIESEKTYLKTGTHGSSIMPRSAGTPQLEGTPLSAEKPRLEGTP